MHKFISHIIVFSALVFGLPALAQESFFIPQPESVSFTEGAFQLDENVKVIVPKKLQGTLIPYLAEKFQNDVKLNLTYSYKEANRGEKYILFKLNKKSELQDEGYQLEVTPESITVTAKDYGGLFNGFQTLRQTFPLEKSEVVTIPAMNVNDNPRFGWRGIMLDVSRHFQDKEYILKQIDVLSAYKINKFHWHLTDDQGWRIEIKKYPNLTDKGAWRADRTGISWWQREKATADEPKTVGGFYTQEDIKEVIAYAKVRNVEVIPEIDIPGHSKALVASYPELFCYDDAEANFEVAVGGKAPDNAVCAGKEYTYEFLEGVIEEIAALFPSEYLHIGGDECNKSNWKKCPYCQKTKAENNLKDEEELQSHFIQRIHKIVKDKKKTMIGWDEILSGNGAPGATIMAWRRGTYTPQITAPQNGYPTIMTSYKYMYISQIQGATVSEPEGPKVVLPLSKVYSHEPMPKELTAEQQELVLGNQASLWGEFTPTEEHNEYMLYPRALASAEVSWSVPENKNWLRFQQSLGDYHFKKLKDWQVNAAHSVFSVYPSYAIDELHNQAIVFLQTETDGNEIYYTLDGKDPTSRSKKYNGKFRTEAKTLLKAGLFNKEGKLLGNVLELRLK
ncbi:beta-N-acetylhexosaminidase [Zobellia alginiliquefaciens]|uniref:beta-N-acetylhexosaminidase n=1 Tax=Zobellia alginiliquefaciens TaxID=3032586 RepID=UPI0023E3EB52|nr:family 20 glycosylhydrolase [Zobellia alginiliquefaciens]